MYYYFNLLYYYFISIDIFFYSSLRLRFSFFRFSTSETEIEQEELCFGWMLRGKGRTRSWFLDFVECGSDGRRYIYISSCTIGFKRPKIWRKTVLQKTIIVLFVWDESAFNLSVWVKCWIMWMLSKRPLIRAKWPLFRIIRTRDSLFMLLEIV